METRTIIAMSGTAELVALMLVLLVHVVGAGALIWALMGDEGWDGLRGWWPRDDDPFEDEVVDPEPDRPRDGLPLPAGAAPSTVRLRAPGRLADAKPRRRRRPAHAPEPTRRPRVK